MGEPASTPVAGCTPRGSDANVLYGKVSHKIQTSGFSRKMGQLTLVGCVCPQGTHMVNSPMGTVLHVAQSVPLLPGSLITMPPQGKD